MQSLQEAPEVLFIQCNDVVQDFSLASANEAGFKVNSI
jgi:hypothetical protein